MDGLKTTMRESEQDDPLLQAYMAEMVVALTKLLPLLTDVKNSRSNNFKAKMVPKQKAETAVEIATWLVDGVLVLHSLWAVDAYVNVYN